MLRRFSWSESYSVGVPSIDEQHKFLIAIIGELQDAMMNGSTREVLPELLTKLTTYVEYHFAWEEQLMEQNGYPGEPEHRSQHADLKRQVEELSVAVQAGKSGAGSPLMRILQRWLTEHISGTDKHLGKFLNGQQPQ